MKGKAFYSLLVLILVAGTVALPVFAQERARAPTVYGSIKRQVKLK